MSKYHRLLKRALLYVPYELYLQKRAQMHTRMAVATIDIDGLKELRKTARQHSPSIMDMKYFDLDYWIQDSIYRVFKLNLHNTRGKSILDIGTGFGYFPYVCNYWGNDACGLDRAGHKLYDEVTDFLGVRKTIHTIKAFEELPPLDGGKFDLVTAFQIGFNFRSSTDVWGSAEWDFFLADLTQNVVKPTGKIIMELNYSAHYQDWCDKKTKSVFAKYNGKIKLGRLTIENKNI